MFEVWTPVIVTNQAHARYNTAGTVSQVNKTKHPDAVVVKFDADGTEEVVALTDLKAL
jgi:hypothetical protein